MTIVTERPPAATAGPGDERRRIAGALAALARRTGEMPPHPYLCRNLAEPASGASPHGRGSSGSSPALRLPPGGGASASSAGRSASTRASIHVLLSAAA